MTQIATVEIDAVGLDTCPLTYSIQDELGRSNLYLSQADGTGAYIMNFLVGATTADYSLEPLSEVSTTAYHFKLSFSEDVFVLDNGYPTVADNDWKLLYDSGDLYLSWCGRTAEPIPPATLKSIAIPIQYQATGTGDTNITVTCYLDSDYCYPVQDRSKLAPCEQGVDFNVELVPREMELTVELVGTSTVLNDGVSSNTLTIRVSNPGSVAIPLSPGTTAFIIGLDTGTDAADLCSMQDFQAASLSVSDTTTYPTIHSNAGDNNLTAYWTVETVNTPGLCIAPMESIDFSIEGLVTNCPAGLSTIFVQCVGLFRMDGTVFPVQVEKSPLLFTGSGTPFESSCGLYVGYDNDTSTSLGGLLFDITTKGPALAVSQSGEGYSAQFTGGAGVGISGVGTSAKGLTISVESSDDGLRVTQSGSGHAAEFCGGAGMTVNNVSSSDTSFYTQNVGSGPALKTDGRAQIFANTGDGSNPTLNVSGSGGSGATALAVSGGDVVMDGKLTLNGDLEVNGSITVTIGDATIVITPQSSTANAGVEMAIKSSSGDLAALRSHGDFNEGWYHLGNPSGENVILLAQSSPTGQGVELAVQLGSGAGANFHCWDAYQDGGVYITPHGGSSHCMLSFDSNDGLQLSNGSSKGPNGTVDTQS